ncbi:MAG: hypothetical protein EOM91_06980 [Sphingobacteriia bacterium]|nr:hypothetical protein [Sphingobacteriia bacterium]NCC38885.1 hypothetical protein [Gammaproteobacteria bacterium]
MFARIQSPLVGLALLLCLLLSVTACSRVGIAYNSADFFIKGYAKDYLELSQTQIAAWEPTLRAALARHRSEELPYLAGYLEQVHQASREGFDQRNTRCLITQMQALYRRQAEFAVTLAAPLLADLAPDQIRALQARFAQQDTEDRAELAERAGPDEQERRARRYTQGIEDWTGPLRPAQRAIITDVTARVPQTQERLLDYRVHQRARLIALLDAGADVARIQSFLTMWLVDFQDLPAELARGGQLLEARISELLIRLGASLDERQHARLQQRLESLRDDLIQLQSAPRSAVLDC